MNDLSWNNYLDLMQLIDSNNYIEQWFSPISLVSYSFYGIDIKYEITDNKEIIFFQKSRLLGIGNLKLNFWYVSQVFYFANSNKKILLETINECSKELNGINNVYYCNISEEMIDFFNLDKSKFSELNYVSNYIYDLDQLKTFSGKKMQKKRNHLNAFVNANYNIKIVDIRDVDINLIFTYLNDHMNKYSNEYREYEIDIYKMYLTNEIKKTNNYKGIVVFIDDNIVALTSGYESKKTYEIIIEKANKDIRGLYQFLIKANLNYHNINCSFIDRQDDAGIENLAISKHSYCPKFEIKRFYNVIS